MSLLLPAEVGMMNTMDPRLTKVAGITSQIEAKLREVTTLRADRARVAWELINDPNTRDTVASVARDIGEPEIRFRKSIQTYRNGVPNFRRTPAS